MSAPLFPLSGDEERVPLASKQLKRKNGGGSSSSSHRMEQSNVLVKVDSSVRELAEGSSLLELGGLLGVLYHHKHISSAPSIRHFPKGKKKK